MENTQNQAVQAMTQEDANEIANRATIQILTQQRDTANNALVQAQSGFQVLSELNKNTEARLTQALEELEKVKAELDLLKQHAKESSQK